jgi:hypothetical protein
VAAHGGRVARRRKTPFERTRLLDPDPFVLSVPFVSSVPAPATPVPPLATPPVLAEPPLAPPAGGPLLPQPKIMGSAKKATTDERRSQVDLFSMGLLDLQLPGQRGSLPVFRERSPARALKSPRSATGCMHFARA